MIEFSIVIPTRDGAATIGRTIMSALAQTYPHFEIIVLESGSTDDTRDVVARFDDERLKLLADDRALDICANWRRILDLDLKPYLTILGHDDLLYPDFLSEIARLIEAQPGASLYHTPFGLIDGADRVIRRCKPFPAWESGESFLRERQRYRRDLFATGYVMRSDDYRRVGGFPPFAGLYYAGSSTIPGIGLPMCLISAELVLKHLRGDTSTGPSPVPERAVHPDEVSP